MASAIEAGAACNYSINSGNVVERVFGNGLILRKIEKLISYTDLKMCRLVSRGWNETILTETDFVQRSLVFVNKESVRNENVLKNFGFKIKHANVSVFLVDKVQRRRKCYMSQANMKTFYGRMVDLKTLDYLDEGSNFHRSRNSTIELFPSLYKIIKKTSNLKELNIQNELLQELADEENDSAIRQILANKLETLESLGIEYDKVAQVEPLPSNTVMGLKLLKRIRFKAVRDATRSDVSLTKLVRLIESNKDTLKELDIDSVTARHNVLPRADFLLFENLMLPHLKFIRLRFADGVASNVGTLIEHHSQQLESVRLNIIGNFTTTLMEKMNTMGPALQVLRLRCTHRGAVAGVSFERFYNLKEFALKHRFSWASDVIEHFPDLFDRMPQSIKKISVAVPESIRAMPSGRAITISKIQSMTRMTSLSLQGLTMSITDETLHAIFKTMINLKKLRICHTSTSPDGFLGYVKHGQNKRRKCQEEACSIANLKGLEHLELINCHISDKTVQEGIKFLGLRYLDITNNKAVTEVGYITALNQNPSLEIFNIDGTLPLAKREVTKRYPRLKNSLISVRIIRERAQ